MRNKKEREEGKNGEGMKEEEEIETSGQVGKREGWRVGGRKRDKKGNRKTQREKWKGILFDFDIVFVFYFFELSRRLKEEVRGSSRDF